jgi:hypothetical protein
MSAEDPLPPIPVNTTPMGIHPRVQTVFWRRAPEKDRTAESYVIYEATVSGQKWQLQLNDFPDEPLYTLLVEGQHVEDFNEFPSCWIRPSDEISPGTNP